MTMLPRVVVSQVKHNSFFVAGVVAGLWLALAVPMSEEEPCAAPPAPPPDEFAVVRETRPPGVGPGAAGARSVQRPRYYTTELGMRAPLLAAILSSEDMLESRVAALNQTAGRLQPALRFFMSASALGSAAPRANVVAFTDTRQMLKPFHALKYLADNYLDDYNFFFLASDAAWVNARRLSHLVSRLSVSQDLHMGVPADDDTHYCSLEGGILISNSVLREVQRSLDWCVRNSYSPRHHENVGRCVLHAARVPCSPHALGERYESVDVSSGALRPELADAVTARGAAPQDMYRLHAYVSRVYLERYQRQQRALGAALGRLRRRAPPHYRNATWPRGLHADPALAPAAPDTRFDHQRWTAFNETHAWLPDDLHTVAPIPKAYKEALQLVWERARAWALREWGDAGDAGDAGGRGTRDVRLVEGAWRWERGPRALRYRLLVAQHHDTRPQVVRQLEVCRPLGAARLAPVPYVTESVRVTLLVPVPARHVAAAARLLRATATFRDVALCVVAISPAGQETDWSPLRAALPPAAALLHATEDPAGLTDPGRLSLAAARGRLARDALVLLLDPRAELNDDFLNRVRMNTIAGSSWYLPVPFARYLPAGAGAAGAGAAAGARRPRSGAFSARRRGTLAFYKRDFDDALAAWRGDSAASVPEILAASALRVLSAPDPALVLAPSREPPCTSASETGDSPGKSGMGDGGSASASEMACLRGLAGERFAGLQLGAAADLARLVLERQASPAA